MTKNTPAEDAAEEAQTQVEVEAEEDLSEAELERKRRQEARREAKRQKQELARIQKEMKGPTSRWVKIALGVIVLLVVVVTVAGYLIYCSYSVNLQRTSYMEDYQRADVARLRQYAREELRRAEELQQQADDSGGALSWQQRIAKYREAEEALAKAVTVAASAADAYDSALTRFRVLKEEAVKSKLDQYAGMLWARVLEAESAATTQSAQDFSATRATERLTEATELLTKASTSYGKLRDFDAVATQFALPLPPCSRRNGAQCAGLLAALRAAQQAEASQEAMDWDKAAEVIKSAMAMITPAVGKMRAEDAGERKRWPDGTGPKAAGGAGTPAAKPPSGRRRRSQRRRETRRRVGLRRDLQAGRRRHRPAGRGRRERSSGQGDLVETLTQKSHDRAAREAPFFAQNLAPRGRVQQLPAHPRHGSPNKTSELGTCSQPLKKRSRRFSMKGTALADLTSERSAWRRHRAALSHLARNFGG